LFNAKKFVQKGSFHFRLNYTHTILLQHLEWRAHKQKVLFTDNYLEIKKLSIKYKAGRSYNNNFPYRISFSKCLFFIEKKTVLGISYQKKKLKIDYAPHFSPKSFFLLIFI